VSNAVQDSSREVAQIKENADSLAALSGSLKQLLNQFKV
jgi:methyl-accepting chemotaxis protein